MEPIDPAINRRVCFLGTAPVGLFLLGVLLSYLPFLPRQTATTLGGVFSGLGIAAGFVCIPWAITLLIRHWRTLSGTARACGLVAPLALLGLIAVMVMVMLTFGPKG